MRVDREVDFGDVDVIVVVATRKGKNWKPRIVLTRNELVTAALRAVLEVLTAEQSSQEKGGENDDHRS